MDYEVRERESINDRNWSWSFLRREFHEENLEHLYKLYVHKIQHGYFSLLLILLIFLYLTHASVLLIVDMKQINVIWPDISIYCAIVGLSLIALFMKETVGKTCTIYPISVTLVTILILVLSNFLAPLYFYSQAMLRPIYTIQIIIACYAFLPLQNNLQAFLLGLAVTICHLIVLGTVIYRNSPDIIYRLGCDTIFMLCINGMGLYFRFMNEILKRRTFLDKRAVVKSTLDLKHEKDQEEQLMLSILPQHIAKRVRDEIKNTVQSVRNDAPREYKPFRDLYVEPHDDVTILYADIVRFTEMTRKLPVIKLVETLNELFGKFDDASEEHNVLRIKFLGDCYYCVSGVPDKNPNHAIKCVELAFDMIKIIQRVRRKRNLNVDMRIGIHTGKIFGGIIGDCKWQYDIWSKDVSITNRMEQTGAPGRVHITYQTLQRLNNKYSVEETEAGMKDELLLENGIKTFFITPTEEETVGEVIPMAVTSSNIFSRRQSASINKTYIKPIPTSVSDSTTVISHRRTAFMNHAVKNYRRRHLETINKLQEAIEQLPIRKFEQWFKWPGINPLLLTFRNIKLELPYFLLPDPIMKYYFLSVFFIIVAIIGIHFLFSSKFHWQMWLIYGTLAFLSIILIPLSWFNPICTRLSLYQRDFEWQNKVTKTIKNASKYLANNVIIRVFIFFAVSSMIASYSVLNLTECGPIVDEKNNATTTINDPDHCFAFWHLTQVCCLTVLASFMFLRIHLWLKLLAGFTISVTFSYFIWNIDSKFYMNGETWNIGLDPKIACIMQIIFLTFTLHLIDRQSEYLNKLDYQWKVQLSSEAKEAQNMHEINNILLQNILPVHVAQIYLDTSRSTDELYHEEYKSVAIMFASVVNLTLKTNDDKILLVLMNEIICGFDRLLLKPCGQKIEKIKVINWTYMAACGLDPGRKDSTASVIRQSGDNIVIQMVKFAVNMMQVLRRIIDKYEQNFQLKIGISHGEVAAGVVGSKKPLYDVWGDTVNMASRMDSTGKPGEIQVTENTANILKKHGIDCIYRGEIEIKSLDAPMPTYFVDLKSCHGLIDNDIER